MEQHDLAFYSTIAQVLPVLVIFAAIELRLLKPDKTAKRQYRKIRIALVATFAPLALFAEQACLLALFTNHAPVAFPKGMVYAVTMVCVGIVFLAPGVFHIGQLGEELGEPEPPSPAPE
jgi:hypothetical protein